jgi:hypothetical protein
VAVQVGACASLTSDTGSIRDSLNHRCRELSLCWAEAESLRRTNCLLRPECLTRDYLDCAKALREHGLKLVQESQSRVRTSLTDDEWRSLHYYALELVDSITADRSYSPMREVVYRILGNA